MEQFVSKDYIKKLYFLQIGNMLARKSPDAIKRKRPVLNIQDTPAFHLALDFVANFMYKHGMEKSLYVANMETNASIPRRGLPIKQGRELMFSDHKDIYQQLINHIRPTKLPVKTRGIPWEEGSSPHNAHHHTHHRSHQHGHHHHRHHSNRRINTATPSVAYRETAQMLFQRAEQELKSLGITSNDLGSAEQLYGEFKQYLIDKKQKMNKPPTVASEQNKLREMEEARIRELEEQQRREQEQARMIAEQEAIKQKKLEEEAKRKAIEAERRKREQELEARRIAEENARKLAQPPKVPSKPPTKPPSIAPANNTPAPVISTTPDFNDDPEPEEDLPEEDAAPTPIIKTRDVSLDAEEDNEEDAEEDNEEEDAGGEEDAGAAEEDAI